MALVFVPQYTLDFSTNAGSDIEYLVTILRSYDDAGNVPSWINNRTSLVGTGEPIEISYERDYDIYKPIQGSKVKLNLLVETEGQYEDFANGTPYEYQLQVQKRLTETTFENIWCGLFNPVDSTERVSTFPFALSFTALDGLGLLEQSRPDNSESDAQVNVFDTFIVPALQQTGLGLQIFVDSQIQRFDDSTDGLLNATVSNYARYKDLEGNGELFTHKELLEGYLAAFNCKITQAKGRWYIYNASTLQDSTTWNVYNHQGIVQQPVPESLVYTIDGTETQDLVPANEDLQITLRRPYGSIECRPKGLVERQHAFNGDFLESANGWTLSTNTTYNATAMAVDIISSFKDVSGNTEATIINTNGFDVNEGAPIEVKFDWEATTIRVDGDAAVLSYQIYAEFDTVPFNIFNLPGFGALYDNTHTYTSTANRNKLYWNNEDGTWVNGPLSGTVIESEVTTLNSNQNASTTTSAISQFSDALNGSMVFQNLKLYVKVFPLQARTDKRNRDNSTTDVAIQVDNISVKNMFDERVIEPTFELVQPNYATTYTYEPLFATTIPSQLYQKLLPNEYVRTGHAIDPIVNGLTLEEIGTRQKLNDFRGQDGTVSAAPFKYYEGSLVNLTDTPLSNINKVRLNWTGIYSELYSGIMNGGNWKLKSNTFDTSFYIPNQALDIAGYKYFTENVDLIAMPFPGRSTKRVYTLAFNVSTDDENGDDIVNGLVPDPPYFTFIGEPGETKDYLINLQPSTGQGGIPSMTSVVSPLPVYAEATGPARILYRNLIIPIKITIPKESQFEQLYIAGLVEPFSPDANPSAVSCTVTVTNSGDFLKQYSAPGGGFSNSIAYNVGGIPGEVKQFTHTIAPVPNIDPTMISDYQLFAGNFSVDEMEGSLTYLDPEGGTDAVDILFTYTVPTSDELDAVATIDGSATPRGQVGVNLSQVTVNFGTEPTGVTWEETSNTFTGFPGGSSDGYEIVVVPNADQEITGITVNSYGTDYVESAGAPYLGDERWRIPIKVTYPPIENHPANVTMDISVTTVDEPYALNFTIHNLGGEGFTITTASGSAEQRVTYHQNDFNDPIDEFVITVSANDNMEFTNIDQVAVDLAEVQAGLPMGLIVPTRSGPSDGDILITVSGNYPAQGGMYNIPINIQATAPLDAAAAALATAEAAVAAGYEPTKRYQFTGVDSGNIFPIQDRFLGHVIYTDAVGIEKILAAGFVDGSILICAQDIPGVSPRLTDVGTIIEVPDTDGLCAGNIFGRRGELYAGDSGRVNGFEIVEGTNAPINASSTTITLVPASTS